MHNEGMPTVVESPARFTPPPHKLWTRAECDRLAAAGFLEPDRYELIGGELVLKVPKGYLHMLSLQLLMTWLQSQFGALHVLQEASIDLRPEDHTANAPEPDACVLRRSMRELRKRPGPEDLDFVAEISNTTLAFDLKVKAALYARTGIPEYWVLDVETQRVIVHRTPESGRYLDVTAYSAGEMVATLSAPEQPIQVAGLF